MLLGTVVAVEAVTLGSALVADAPTGTTVLSVDFAGDFDEDGGQLALLGSTLDYTTVDVDADTITLASALTFDAVAADPVASVVGGIPAVEWVAHVALNEGDGDTADTIAAVIPTALVAYFPEGAYDDPVPVELEVRDSGEYRVATQPGVPPKFDGGFLNPTTVPTARDGVPPGAVASAATLGGLGLIFVKWSAVTTNANGDPQKEPVRYRVHVSTSATFAYDDTTLATVTGGTMAALKALADGTLFAYDTTYYFAVVPYDEDGTGTASPVTSGAMDRTASGDLAARSVTADSLAGIVVLGSTVSTRSFDVDGVTLTGPGIDLTPDGMFTYDQAGNKRVELPNVGTYTFRGDAEIDHLTVQTLTTLQATLVGAGSAVTLQTVVAPPTNPPTYTITWKSIQHTDDGKWGDRLGLAYDSASTNWYTTRSGGDALMVEKWSTAGALLLTDTKGATDRAYSPSGCCMGPNGGLYVLAWNPVNGWVIYQYNATTLAQVFAWTVSAANATTLEPYSTSGTRRAALAYDSTAGQFIVGQSRVTNADKVRLYRFTLPAGVAGNPVPVTPVAGGTLDSAFAYPYWLSHLAYGTFDLGVARYVFGNTGSSAYQVMDATGASDPASQFDNPTAGNRGLTWDGTYFQAVSTTGKRYRFENGNKWSSLIAGDSTWYAAYTWRNAATPAETVLSPVVSLTMKRRAQLVVTTPALPPGVTEARTYFAKGSTPPNTAAQSMTLAGSTTGTAQPSRTNTATLFTPLNNPTTTSFVATGSPATIVSSDSPTAPKIKLSGDGSGRVGPWSWDVNNNVVTQAAVPADPGKVDTSALLFGRKTAATSTTGTTAVASGLTLTLAVGTYTFVMRGTYQAAATTTGIGLRVGGTAVESAMFAELLIAGGANSSTAAWFSRTLTAMGQAASNTTGVQVAATPAPFRVEGFIIVSTAGTITLDFQSQVSGSAVQINAGSSIQAVKVA